MSRPWDWQAFREGFTYGLSMQPIWRPIQSAFYDFRYGYWDCGIGYWKGSARWFAFNRNWYDGPWWGFRLGPFWACCAPIKPDDAP